MEDNQKEYLTVEDFRDRLNDLMEMDEAYKDYSVNIAFDDEIRIAHGHLLTRESKQMILCDDRAILRAQLIKNPPKGES